VGTSTQTITGGAGPVTVKTVNTDQAFTLSAQFAKRLAEHYVLTAGIVEGKGGAGAEYRTLEDRLRLGVLGYDFTKQDYKPKPRYRITGSFQLGSKGWAAVRPVS